jgi:hypothetical protein
MSCARRGRCEWILWRMGELQSRSQSKTSKPPTPLRAASPLRPLSFSSALIRPAGTDEARVQYAVAVHAGNHPPNNSF